MGPPDGEEILPWLVKQWKIETQMLKDSEILLVKSILYMAKDGYLLLKYGEKENSLPDFYEHFAKYPLEGTWALNLIIDSLSECYGGCDWQVPYPVIDLLIGQIAETSYSSLADIA